MLGSLHLNHFQSERLNVYEFSDTTIYLTEKESGSLIFLDPSSATGSMSINLPMISSSTGNTSTNKTFKGLNYTFIFKTISNDNDVTITSKNSSNVNTALMYGEGNPQISNTSAITNIKLNKTHQEKGDRINLICDGHNWYITWILQSTNAITLS